MKVKDITNYLESLAPRSYQESYDNAGLITGNPNEVVTGILVTLDCVESIIHEAIVMGANLIVAHHPIVFKGLKQLIGKNYVERTIILAIQHNIAIYAIHTNLDHVVVGVNKRICDQIGLQNTSILVPKQETLSKLVTFIPKGNAEEVLQALYQAGAGQIGNYQHCSFQIDGKGTFMPNEDAQPHIGQANKLETVGETRIEVLVPTHLEQAILQALHVSHPYEVPAYYLTGLRNKNQDVGAGMIGELAEATDPEAFLRSLKIKMHVSVIRHTPLGNKKIKKVAVCGGAGSFLLSYAKAAGADVFVSADFKYHEFFDAENQIVIADIGHYESEAFTKQLLVEFLTKKFPTFAVYFSKIVTNPIIYL